MSAGDALIPTEAVDAETVGLDVLPTVDLVRRLVAANRRAVDAVAAASEQLAAAAELVAAAVRAGGALHYVGAGTSGRLGVLDAAEQPPTFGVAPELVRAHLAGGRDAVFRAVEGAEDDAAAGRALGATFAAGDVAVGLSASGGARFVVAALEAARARRVRTVAITSVAGSALARAAELAIVLETGAEPLAGSTRLGAGTAQKIALNALSTAAMVRLGKVYDNLMVDVVATNEKLRARALRLVRALAAVDAPEAGRLLEAAGGNVKVAVVMARRGVDPEAARALLAAHDGLRRAVVD